MTIEFHDIDRAAKRIHGAIINTPMMASRTLSEIAGGEIFVKFENLQFTGSFKERGALNKLLGLELTERENGVIAVSAGNHAQGVAYHAKRLKIPATIVMPKGTPFTKVSRTKNHGARVLLEGEGLAEATTFAQAIADQEGLAFVHPFDDPLVIAGQGTLALEMLASVPSLDVLVVPIGGGGLISGMAIAAKAIAPNIKVIGVQSAAYLSMMQVMRAGKVQFCGGLTITEGIALKTPGALTKKIVREMVDDIVIVDEASIEQAVALLLNVEKTVAEGAGAAALAAVVTNPERFAGLRVGIPVTGGNIDFRVLASVAMRELVRAGQLIHLSVSVSDQPGSLSNVTRAIGEAGGNIVEVAHNRLSLGLTAKGTALEVIVEVQNKKHGEDLVSYLNNMGHLAKMVN